jgi:hypothetical protein
VSLGAFEAIAVATAMPTVAVALDGLAVYALAFAEPRWPEGWRWWRCSSQDGPA